MTPPLLRIIGMLVGLETVDATLVHMVVPKIEFVHSVFSDSALGDDTSTCSTKNDIINFCF